MAAAQIEILGLRNLEESGRAVRKVAAQRLTDPQCAGHELDAPEVAPCPGVLQVLLNGGDQVIQWIAPEQTGVDIVTESVDGVLEIAGGLPDAVGLQVVLRRLAQRTEPVPQGAAHHQVRHTGLGGPGKL